MRKLGWTLAAIGTLALVPGISSLSCSNIEGDCETINTCTGALG